MSEFIAFGLQLPEAASRRLWRVVSPDQPFTDTQRPGLQGKAISAQNSQPMGFSSFRDFARLQQRRFTSLFHNTIESLLLERSFNSTLVICKSFLFQCFHKTVQIQYSQESLMTRAAWCSITNNNISFPVNAVYIHKKNNTE